MNECFSISRANKVNERLYSCSEATFHDVFELEVFSFEKVKMAAKMSRLAIIGGRPLEQIEKIFTCDIGGIRIVRVFHVTHYLLLAVRSRSTNIKSKKNETTK